MELLASQLTIHAAGAAAVPAAEGLLPGGVLPVVPLSMLQEVTTAVQVEMNSLRGQVSELEEKWRNEERKTEASRTRARRERMRAEDLQQQVAWLLEDKPEPQRRSVSSSDPSKLRTAREAIKALKTDLKESLDAVNPSIRAQVADSLIKFLQDCDYPSKKRRTSRAAAGPGPHSPMMPLQTQAQSGSTQVLVSRPLPAAVAPPGDDKLPSFLLR